MTLERCKVCGKEIYYARKYSGEKLCKDCFVNSLIRRVKKTIAKYKLLEINDNIVVKASNKPENVFMLHILAFIESNFPKTTIFIEKGNEQADIRWLNQLINIENVKIQFLNGKKDDLKIKRAIPRCLDQVAEEILLNMSKGISPCLIWNHKRGNEIYPISEVPYEEILKYNRLYNLNVEPRQPLLHSLKVEYMFGIIRSLETLCSKMLNQ